MSRHQRPACPQEHGRGLIGAVDILLIMLQCPNATRVTGFSQWKALGRSVKKGEKGIMILAPRPFTRPNAAGEDETRLFFKTVFVFDESQTEGEELPALRVPVLAEDAGHDLYARLIAYAEREGLTVITEADDAPASAMGYYSRQRRVVFARLAAQLQILKTLIHELGHHHDDLANEHEVLETVAEGVAYVVCSYFGLDASERSFPYIAGWSGQEGGAALLKQTLTTIQRIAGQLIAAAPPTISPIPRRPPSPWRTWSTTDSTGTDPRVDQEREQGLVAAAAGIRLLTRGAE